jgi:citrate lyase subunit beta/citryl-CoA lyase
VAADIVRDLDADNPEVWVRVNSPSTPWGERDLVALAGVTLDGIRVPRCEDPLDVRKVAAAVGCPLQLLLETARGLMTARELARADPAVCGIGLGEADLAADLRVTSEGLAWARGWVVAVSREAGLPSPVQSVYTDVADLDGLRATTVTARAHGFFGRSLVHPRQIAPVHDVYRPTAQETERAREVFEAWGDAQSRGEAAALTADGRFVDPAVVSQAQLVLELAARASTAPSTADTLNEEHR